MQSPQDTRDRILEKTWELLEAGGPAQVRMTDVARSAGLSRQALYLHFGNRAGLLVALVAFIDERRDLGAVLRWVGQSASAGELIQRLTRQQVIFNPRIDGIAQALEREADTDPDARQALENRMEDRLAGMREAAAKLRAWGALRRDLDVEVAADLMWATLSLGVWRGLVLQRGWSDDAYCHHIEGLLQRLLLEE